MRAGRLGCRPQAARRAAVAQGAPSCRWPARAASSAAAAQADVVITRCVVSARAVPGISTGRSRRLALAAWLRRLVSEPADHLRNGGPAPAARRRDRALAVVIHPGRAWGVAGRGGARSASYPGGKEGRRPMTTGPPAVHAEELMWLELGVQ